MSDGMMILLFFILIIGVPLVIVLLGLWIYKMGREKKKASYQGMVEGTIVQLKKRGREAPWIIKVNYCVDGMNYQIQETVKLKSQAIRWKGIPIGQRKTFVLGKIKEGDPILIRYDMNDPKRAIIDGNDGLINN